MAAFPLLRAEGYDLVSLSGGEPLLYPALAEVCDEARHQGFRLAAISNGFRVRKSNAEVLAKLDALAISFDGMEANHLAMRRHPKAWSAALEALETLREIGKPSVAAFTVSAASLAEVPEFVELAASKGVRAVQLRPLVSAGRAVSGADSACLSAADERRLWLMAETLKRAYEGELALHVDLAPAEALLADADAWSGLLSKASDAKLSDQINPLVITPEGVLKPFTFDFPAEFDLGRIESLATGIDHRRVAALADVTDRAFKGLAQSTRFVDWFAYLRDVANGEVLSMV